MGSGETGALHKSWEADMFTAAVHGANCPLHHMLEYLLWDNDTTKPCSSCTITIHQSPIEEI